jgi:hypothetical protein
MRAETMREEPLTCLFGRQRMAVDLSTYRGRGTLTLKHIELAGGALIVPRKA